MKLWVLVWRKFRSKVVEFDMCVFKYVLVDLYKNFYFKIFICGILKLYLIGVMCFKWVIVICLNLVYWIDWDCLYFLIFIREIEEKLYYYNLIYLFVFNGILGICWDFFVFFFWDMI